MSSSLKSLRRAYKGVSSDDQQSSFSPTVAQPIVTQKTFINLDKYVFQLGKILLSIRTKKLSMWTNIFVNLNKYMFSDDRQSFSCATVAQPVLLHLFKHQLGEVGAEACKYYSWTPVIHKLTFTLG